MNRWVVGLPRRRWWLRMLSLQAQQALGGLNVLGLVQEHPGNHPDPKNNSTRRAMAQEHAGEPGFEFFYTFGQGGGARRQCLFVRDGQRKTKP